MFIIVDPSSDSWIFNSYRMCRSVSKLHNYGNEYDTVYLGDGEHIESQIIFPNRGQACKMNTRRVE